MDTKETGHSWNQCGFKNSVADLDPDFAISWSFSFPFSSITQELSPQPLGALVPLSALTTGHLLYSSANCKVHLIFNFNFFFFCQTNIARGLWPSKK